MRRATIKDVAKAAGVSAATVSYVMNDLGRVTAEVDAHVRAVAESLGYRRSRAALALKTGRHGAIGCLLPNLLSPIFPVIASAVQGRAEELGLSTLLVDTGDTPRSEAEALRLLGEQGVDGVVAVLNAPPPEGLSYPVVTLDCRFEGVDSIRCDHFEGGRLAAHLAHGMGYRRAGLFIGSLKVASSVERSQGFLQGAQEVGLSVVWQHEVPLGHDLPDFAQAAIAAGEADFIACVNDMVAIGALSVARALGLSVPNEVAIMGFDDIPMAAWPVIGLSTLAQDCKLLGVGAVEMLMRRIEEPEAPREERILPVVPMLRATTHQA